jgi:hypothetical protein
LEEAKYKSDVSMSVYASLLILMVLCLIIPAGFAGTSTIQITLDKVRYLLGQDVVAEVQVQDEGAPKSNQLVSVSWILPSGLTAKNETGLTDKGGSISLQLHLDLAYPTGIYEVRAQAQNMTTSAFFEVFAPKSYSLTISMKSVSVPIWVNGTRRSEGNTTLILAQGTYGIEVPAEYQGWSFQMWKTTTGNHTNPRLTIQLDKETRLEVVYVPSETNQILSVVSPYMLPAVLVLVCAIGLYWVYREGYI